MNNNKKAFNSKREYTKSNSKEALSYFKNGQEVIVHGTIHSIRITNFNNILYKLINVKIEHENIEYIFIKLPKTAKLSHRRKTITILGIIEFYVSNNNKIKYGIKSSSIVLL